MTKVRTIELDSTPQGSQGLQGLQGQIVYAVLACGMTESKLHSIWTNRTTAVTIRNNLRDVDSRRHVIVVEISLDVNPMHYSDSNDNIDWNDWGELATVDEQNHINQTNPADTGRRNILNADILGTTYQRRIDRHNEIRRDYGSRGMR